MAERNDWESLLDGVFGPNGRLGGGTAGKSGTGALQDELMQAQKELEAALTRQQKAGQAARATGPDALLEMSERISRQIRQQSRQISGEPQAQPREQAPALDDLSMELARNLQQDGLLTAGEAAAAAPAAQAEDFAGVAQEVEKTILGQPDFVKKLTIAFKRPFVMGRDGEKPAGSILIWGKEGTGRHSALQALTEVLAERKILTDKSVAWVDLGLYSGPAQEKLFLQDMYAAFAAPGQVVAFDNYEKCHPGFLNMLAALIENGKAPLSSRYLLQKGMLVEAGSSLAPQAVGSLTAQGKYIVLFSRKGAPKLAEQMGAAVVNAIGDVCATSEFDEEAKLAIAKQKLEQLRLKAEARLKMKPELAGDLCALTAAQADRDRCAEPIAEYCEMLFRALSEYKLLHDPAAGETVRMYAKDGRAMADIGGEQVDLAALLPREYTGALEEVKRELDNIVGLDEVKAYVLGLEDHVKAQRRRAAAGMKAAGVSMHMIFTGNPGTGKTTIARLVGKYLKAIGALSGGQLIEVSRADLVGRYVGHTAPLTNQVIRSALGGVLFIDEAYSLYRGKDDSFGLEAIDTLVKGIEDNRDDLVVILAGYSKEMAGFLSSNSGLSSRFPNQIEFADYTGQQLLDITHINAKSQGYRLEEACDALLLEYFDKVQANSAARSGNGRLARNKLEEAIVNQSRRMAAEPDAPLDLLKAGDFELEELPAPAPNGQDALARLQELADSLQR